MTRISKVLDAWPESTQELLTLMESFDRLQKKHAGAYVLRFSIFSMPMAQAEIDAVLNASDKFTAAAGLFAKNLIFRADSDPIC